MTIMDVTRSILENLVGDGSIKWLLDKKCSFDEEFAQSKWISELSAIANAVVYRCSRILGISMENLQANFENIVPDSVKYPSIYARNLLEYCCLQVLTPLTEVTSHLADKNFRRLMYDMMLAWETPSATSDKVDAQNTVGRDSFCRMAPAVPTIADVVTSDTIFDILTSTTSGRLTFSVYDKYLGGLERAIQKVKTQSESSLLSSLRSCRGERILEIDGTVTTQPVLQHVGISTWPGRLILTDHALYFGALRVVTFDKATVYSLSDDLNQVIKPDFTGPWGTRLFDKAISYKSVSMPEPVVFEFPELTGHIRRDYWLAILQEILCVHRFVRKFQIEGIKLEEALSKAILGILRLQAIKEVFSKTSLRFESLLMFSLADQLPGGDKILEAVASLLDSRKSRRNNPSFRESSICCSLSSFSILSNAGLVLNSKSDVNHELVVGEIFLGEVSSLEKAIKDCRNNLKKVEHAQATVDGVKVEGVATNLAVMKELLIPVTEIVKYFLFLASWDDPLKSLLFCCVTSYIIWREWLAYVFSLLILLIAMFMILTRYLSQGQLAVVKVEVPPMKTVEKLVAIPNAISYLEEFLQDGNIVLLKFRSLLLAVLPEGNYRVPLAMLAVAMILTFLPGKYIILLIFLNLFTMNSGLRKAQTEKMIRRFREWWYSIPAAPVLLEALKEEDKKKL